MTTTRVLLEAPGGRAYPATLECKVEYGENGDQAFFLSAIDVAGQVALADLHERFRYGRKDNAHTEKCVHDKIGVKQICLVVPRH